MKVLASLLAVKAEIAAHGISKSRRNQEQKFNFRGIDDALAAFAPLLVKNQLLVAPKCSDLVIEPRQTKSGGTTYNVRLKAEFTFTHVEDGSTYTVGPFYGEANDGQDKAVSKATSIAERNMFFLSFVVPHEAAIGGDPDGSSGEEAADGVDLQAWFSKIDDAADEDELKSIAAEIKETVKQPAALRHIRARWVQRSNKLKAMT